MTILLVDDEADILEGIMDGVSFGDIGIHTVLTARSAAEARRLLQAQPVDIMLTDIEMPGESGLELLAWVRRRKYELVSLFCTSYASFDYAQKAVEMHSFDYYLKPIAYDELQQRLAAAVAQVKKNQSDQNYKRLGEYWLSSQKDNKRSFWTDMLFTTSSLSELQRTAAQNGLQYAPEDRFVSCAMMALDNQEPALAEWKVYGFRNVAEELFTTAGLQPEAMIPAFEGSWLLVLRETPQLTAGGLESLCRRLIRQQAGLFDVDMSCYYLNGCPIEEMRAAFARLKQVFTDDVCSRGAVWDAAAYPLRSLPYSQQGMPDWAALLAAGDEAALCGALDGWLDTLCEAGSINQKALMALRTGVLQAVYAELERRGINFHTLLLDEEYDRLLAVSLSAVFKCKAYLHYVFARALEQVRFAAESQTVVGQVKEYIKNHLNEEVNRSTIAQRVFLNPDYLARLFKRETGQTLGAYLQAQRIEAAKALLARDSVPVNEVAQRVGYDNYSYFSHIFKEKTGMSPGEYRKSVQ